MTESGAFDDMLKTLDETMDRLRSDYHLTLGGAIKYLHSVNAAAIVRFDVGGFPTGPHSYRGYYSDLAFEAAGCPVTAGQFLADLKRSLGSPFTGYRGGEFEMHEATPLWMAEYGCCGRAVLDIRIENGDVVLMTKEIPV